MKKRMMFKALPIAVFIFFVSACSSEAYKEHAETESGHGDTLNKLDSYRSEPLPKTNGKVQVYLLVKSADEAEILQLKEVGVEIEIVNKKLNKIQAMVDKGKLNELRMLDNVLSITNPSYGHLRSHTQ